MGSLVRRTAAQRAFLNRDGAKPLAFRLAVLGRLETRIHEQEDTILAAFRLNLSKSRTEAYMMEFALVYGELQEVRRELHVWARTECVRGGLASFPARNFIYREPCGAVPIPAPWNYPFYLSIAPLIAAIAAGNCAIIRYSEESVYTSALIRKFLRAAFPAPLVYCTASDTDYEELLRQRYDYIFFTGSSHVRKVVTRAMSEHPMPVTLELGGKSPCIADKSANIKFVARHIAQGKFLNVGQTCIAVDYVLVQRHTRAALIQVLVAEVGRRYHRAEQWESYPKIISRRHYERLVDLIAAGKEVTDGAINERTEKIASTFLLEVDFDHTCMQEKISGPLLPIIVYGEFETAIRGTKVRKKPLACYILTRDKWKAEGFIHKLSFGGDCVNGVLLQVGNHCLPFSGVRSNDMGVYHGRCGFETFSHTEAVVKSTGSSNLPFRYTPFDKGKWKFLKKFLQAGSVNREV